MERRRGPLFAQHFAGGEPEAAATIVYVESEFRGIERWYAGALATSRPEAFGPLAQFNAGAPAPHDVQGQ